MTSYKNVTEYIEADKGEVKTKIKEMRALVRKLVPKGEETISYGMPTVKLNGSNFLHYASMKGYLGFYPSPSGVSAYESELRKLGIDYSKGCVRFRYDKKLPTALITKIIKFRLKEEK